MTQPQLSQRLTSMDASFLYFEKKEAPMHVGSVSVFDGEVPYEEFIRYMEAKLPLLPRYRQKVSNVPFNLGHPSWERDPNFNIRNHIFFVQLEAPGSDRELSKLAGKCLSGMLDRNKPLWEIWIVHGLEGGRSALISRVHHAMVDGISGVDLTKVMFDISPDAPMPELKEVNPVVAPPVNSTKSLIDGLLDSAEERLRSWNEFQSGLLNLTQTLTKSPTSLWSQPIPNNLLPTVTTPVQILPFNRPNSGERYLVWNVISFPEARAIRAAIGGTVNDVVLTVLSGAIARYARLHGQKTTGRNLRVMVPVSMRREDQRGALGNLVSVLPVEIPLDIEKPIERLQYLTKKTSELKGSRLAESINVFSALMGTVPASVQALFGSLANTSIPPFNTVCTNVPGPQIPLYALGNRLIAWYPYVPVGYGMGVGCAIMSYDQKLFFGLTSDPQIMPDVERLKEFVDESFVELREAAGVGAIKTQVS